MSTKLTVGVWGKVKARSCPKGLAARRKHRKKGKGKRGNTAKSRVVPGFAWVLKNLLCLSVLI